MAITGEKPSQNGDVAAANSLQPAGLNELEDYKLPTKRLKRKLDEKDKGRTPLVLCACGSFSPITYCAFLLSLLKAPQG